MVVGSALDRLNLPQSAEQYTWLSVYVVNDLWQYLQVLINFGWLWYALLEHDREQYFALRLP
jgi:hypothetical protein